MRGCQAKIVLRKETIPSTCGASSSRMTPADRGELATEQASKPNENQSNSSDKNTCTAFIAKFQVDEERIINALHGDVQPDQRRL
jgi:hypothetical protein